LAASTQLTEQKRRDQIRFRGHRGGMITMHRALEHFHLGPMNLLVAIALFLSFTVLWLAALPEVCRIWQGFFAAGLRYLPLDAKLDTIHHQVGFLKFAMPSLLIRPILPGFGMWAGATLATVVLFAATFLLPTTMVPIIYLSRAILIIQGTACAYFAIWPSQFPHTPDSYIQGLMLFSIAMITIVPLLFTMTYYIFDFGILRKALLTSLTMVYLALFVPLQVLFQAILLQKTVMFMPLLYIIFGMPADVMIIVAFYSWGMTWPFRRR
jgi:hypothetical protein